MTFNDYKSNQLDSLRKARLSRPPWWNATREESDRLLDRCEEIIGLVYLGIDPSIPVRDTVEARFSHVASGEKGSGFYLCWLDWRKKAFRSREGINKPYPDCIKYFSILIWPKHPAEFQAFPCEGRGTPDEDEDYDTWTLEEMGAVGSERVVSEILRVVRSEAEKEVSK